MSPRVMVMASVMASVMVIAMVLVPVLALAQNSSLPDAPSTPELNRGGKTAAKVGYPYQGLFRASLITHYVATGFDAATTIHGLDRKRCREVYPIFGPHPGPGKVIGLEIAYTVPYTLASIWYVHRRPEHARAIAIFNFLLAGGHTAAGVNNMSQCF